MELSANKKKQIKETFLKSFIYFHENMTNKIYQLQVKSILKTIRKNQEFDVFSTSHTWPSRFFFIKS